MEGGSVTVETTGGIQTVALTDTTRFLGAGAGAQGGSKAPASNLTAGEEVTVVARKAADGSLEAIVVRAGAIVRQSRAVSWLFRRAQ